MGYLNGMVYFIDILGSKNRNFEDSLKIHHIFNDELANSIKRYYFESIGKRYVTSFSDCAYILYIIENEFNTEEIFLSYIFDSLFKTANTIAFFAVNGFLCRGGISCGEVYFDKEKNILFGPAVTKAYLLEQEAKMPRLIFDDTLANKLIQYDREIKSKDDFTKILNGTIIIKDKIDHRYYLNYLNCLASRKTIGVGGHLYDVDDYWEKLKMNSQKTLKREKDHEIIAKINWHLNYLETIRQDNKKRQKFSDSELLDLYLKSKYNSKIQNDA
jgi:hypothetical protein